MGSIAVLDTQWVGRSQATASVLLESDGHLALVDPGPASTLETIRAELKTRGIELRDLNALLLTHIHLDHAGASGTILRDNPELPVYVHQNGAPHLIDPSKLLASAGRLWGDDLPRLFGETLPVSKENLRILSGGETLDLGGRKIEVAYTPGHASHHVSYFDAEEGIAFVGDTAGIRIENGPYIMPATPPPDIDLTLWDGSFATILARRPEKLFLTHYGFAENPEAHIAIFRERLHAWAGMAGKIMQLATSDTEAVQEFMAVARADIAQNLPPDETEQYAFTAGLDLSFLGLARHLRKRAGA